MRGTIRETGTLIPGSVVPYRSLGNRKACGAKKKMTDTARAMREAIKSANSGGASNAGFHECLAVSAARLNSGYGPGKRYATDHPSTAGSPGSDNTQHSGTRSCRRGGLSGARRDPQCPSVQGPPEPHCLPGMVVGRRDLEGDGRVGLYAGFCARRSRDRRRRPSISACRCRQALATYPQARASSPQTPAPATTSRR